MSWIAFIYCNSNTILHFGKSDRCNTKLILGRLFENLAWRNMKKIKLIQKKISQRLDRLPQNAFRIKRSMTPWRWIVRKLATGRHIALLEIIHLTVHWFVAFCLKALNKEMEPAARYLEISVHRLPVQMIKTKNVAVNHSSRITGWTKITSHRTINLIWRQEGWK